MATEASTPKNPLLGWPQASPRGDKLKCMLTYVKLGKNETHLIPFFPRSLSANLSMTGISPLYTSLNTTHAYQLNWSLSLFLKSCVPPLVQWLEPLRRATESDAVRILEVRELERLSLQFYLSTQPHVSPSDIVRSAKGRLQYLLRMTIPQAFQRNYGIFSVGAANIHCLEAYVQKQPSRHPMAATHVQQRIDSFQFYDDKIDLREYRASSHGRYLHNLQIVLENRDHLHDASERTLSTIRSMVIRSCAKKNQRLARIGLVSNHLHILLGCSVDESPQMVALALMNNIAYAFEMKPVLEFSFYAGTFGPYDRGAIRKEYS